MKKLCECGCGNPAPIATRTNKKRGWIKGNPLRFISGHNGKLRPSGVISYKIDEKTGCWNWKRGFISNGYGCLRVNNKCVLAHRYVYERFKGKIPDLMTLDHLCRNHSCVNPDHLEPVSHAENCRRGIRAKLNHKKVAKIRKLHQSGLTIYRIAKHYFLDWHTVRDIVEGKSWI